MFDISQMMIGGGDAPQPPFMSQGLSHGPASSQSLNNVSSQGGVAQQVFQPASNANVAAPPQPALQRPRQKINVNVNSRQPAGAAAGAAAGSTSAQIPGNMGNIPLLRK